MAICGIEFSEVKWTHKQVREALADPESHKRIDQLIELVKTIVDGCIQSCEYEEALVTYPVSLMDAIGRASYLADQRGDETLAFLLRCVVGQIRLETWHTRIHEKIALGEPLMNPDMIVERVYTQWVKRGKDPISDRIIYHEEYQK